MFILSWGLWSITKGSTGGGTVLGATRKAEQGFTGGDSGKDPPAVGCTLSKHQLLVVLGRIREPADKLLVARAKRI